MHAVDNDDLLPKELDRLTVIDKYRSGFITQVDAARALQISERQVRRIIRHYESSGVSGLRMADAAKGLVNAFQNLSRPKH